MQDDEIRKYIDLFIKEEIENGGDPYAYFMSLEDIIKVYNLKAYVSL